MRRQDWCANYIGQGWWLDALDWERAAQWQSAPEEVWEVDGEKAGTVKTAEPLTYVKVDAAGHMVRLVAWEPWCTLSSAAFGRSVSELPVSEQGSQSSCRL